MGWKRLQYVPQQALNLANLVQPSAFVEPITGQIIPGGGLIYGDYVDVTLAEATNLSAAGLPLYEGRYQFVQVESGAVAANVKRGTIAFIRQLAPQTLVTDFSRALSANLPIGVFLNSITPGNYGWIQVMGRGSILGGSAFTGAAAIGAILIPTTGGVIDIPTSQTACPPNMIGVALNLPVINTITQARLELTFSSY